MGGSDVNIEQLQEPIRKPIRQREQHHLLINAIENTDYQDNGMTQPSFRLVANHSIELIVLTRFGSAIQETNLMA